MDFTAMPTATWVLSPKGREALTHSPSRDHGRFNYKLRARGTLPRTSPSYRVGAFEEEISLLLRRLPVAARACRIPSQHPCACVSAAEWSRVTSPARPPMSQPPDPSEGRGQHGTRAPPRDADIS